jgi:hypothetical protein
MGYLAMKKLKRNRKRSVYNENKMRKSQKEEHG